MKPPYKVKNKMVVDAEGKEILRVSEEANDSFISTLAIIMNENQNRLLYTYLGEDSSSSSK